MRTHRRIVALSFAVILAACTGSGGSSPLATVPASNGNPTPGAASPTRSPAAATSWSTDSAMAVDELMAAIGNPDTGSKSEAWNAFEAALAAGDAGRIASTAEPVQSHLLRARSLLAPYLDSAANGLAAREWDANLVGIADGVARMRDGGMAGSTAVVEAGRARMTDALRDHFYQAVYGPSADRWQVRWPWPDSRIVTPSRSRLGNEAGQAVDGRAETWWTAGDAPAPQWIEIDLGRVVTLTGVRLLTFQPAAGETDHRVRISGPAVASQELVAFTGTTRDSEWLEFTAQRPIRGIQAVRVTTLATASPVGWREVEIVLAPESRLTACAPGTTNLAIQRPSTASSSASDSKASLAVDGNRATRWESAAPAPQSIEIDLGRDTSVSSVQLLPGGSPADAIAVVVRGRDSAGHAMVLGFVNNKKTGSDWLTVAGPTPCVGLRWISIESGWSAGPVSWREIEVLGSKTG